MSRNVLVVIPAHNEEESIARTLMDLREAAPSFERIVVNDGSTDSTGDIVAALGERQLRLLSHVGYGPALQAGIRYALGRGCDVVCFDADGQHRAEDVPFMVEALYADSADVVIGSRFNSDTPYTGPLTRRAGQILFSHLTRLLLGRRLYDTTSGFKAMRAAACEVIVRGTFLDFHAETLVRLGLLGFRIIEVPITVRERTYGQSMYSLSSVVQYPAMTLFLTMVAVIDAHLARRGQMT